MNPELWFIDLSAVSQTLFSLVPELVHFLQRGLAGTASLLAQALLDVAETALEFAVGAPQCHLRIDAQIAADVDDTEQHVAELVGDCRRTGLLTEPGAQLAQFFVQLVERSVDVRPLEADLCRSLAELVRARECRQRQWHVGENALAGTLALEAFLFFPRYGLCDRSFDLSITENVRMAAFQLVADCRGHVVERERALLLRHARVKHD